MPRSKDQRGDRLIVGLSDCLIDQCRVDAQKRLVFARPGGTTEKDARTRRRINPIAQLRLLHGVAVGDIELEAARDRNNRFRCPRGKQTRLVRLALRKDRRETAEDVLEDPPRLCIAWCTAVADPRVDEEERNAVAFRLADENRPDFALGENDRARTHQTKRTLHETREIKRIVNEHITIRHLALGHLPSR